MGGCAEHRVQWKAGPEALAEVSELLVMLSIPMFRPF